MAEDAVKFQSFVGVDLHKCTVTLRAVDPATQPIAALTVSTKCGEKIHNWLLALPRPVWMAVEACPFIEWFIDRYRSAVDRLDIADATELANRRGKRPKNDDRDALDVAVRLARGDCPLGWIADDELLHLRKLGRHWWQLSRTLTRAKASMRSILHSMNLQGPKLDAACAHKWFLANGQLLKDVYRVSFANFLDQVALIERQREDLRLRITLANRSERFARVMNLVKSVPGIDEIWACIITAEIGEFSRFPNADALEFWAGLTPDNQTSAGKTRAGHITKAGSRTLRWALGNAARCLCRCDGRQKRLRERVLRNCGRIKPKANVAMARRLLGTLFAMVRDGTPYDNVEPINPAAKATRARLAQRRQKGPAHAA